MRSPLWFVLAGVIAVAGLAAAALYAMPRIARVDQRITRIVVPGSAVLALDRPGTYTIFHERRSVINGRYYASDSADGLRVTVVAEAGGAPVALNQPRMSSSYTIEGHEGKSILAFDVTEAGRYRLTANLTSGAAEPKVVLAVSRGLVGAVFQVVLTTLGIAFGSFGVAGLLVLLVVWRRSKAMAV